MQTGASLEPADLATQPPSRAQSRGALAILLGSTCVFLGLIPFVKTKLTGGVEFVAMYDAAVTVIYLATAIFLLGQVQAQRSRPLAFLALAYLYTALLAVAHMLSFPGLFAPLGLLGGNVHTTAWLYMLWHGLFPLFVAAYALGPARALTPYFMRLGGLCTVLLAAAITLLATAGAALLPEIVAPNRHTPRFMAAVGTVLCLNLLGLAAVARRRPRSLLDLWLVVVMAASVFDIGLSAAVNGGRFDLGFYAGRIYGLLASMFVLGALAIENIGLHTRLRATLEEMVETRARAQANGLLESVLRQLPEGVVILDRNRQCLMANYRATSLARLFGDDEAAAADGPQAALLALIGERGLRAAAGETFKDEIMERSSGAGRHVYSVSGAPVRDATGAVAAAVVVLDDVTERVDANHALRRALDQTRYLVENTPLAVIEWDREFVVTLWNRRAEEMFGWSAVEMVGHRIDAFPIIHEDDADKVAAVMAHMLDSAHHYVKSENRNRTRDGRIIHSEWYNSILHDGDGNIVTVFSLVLDVTERKLAMEQLQDADRRKDVYIATLAHELRNPLAPIANAATLLGSKQLEPERLAWIAAMVGRQAAQMARLLDDLLDVSRISRGKIELQKTCVDLRRVIRDALQTCGPLVEAGRHEVRLSLPPGPVWAEVDTLRLGQVLANLINNAAKYTSPGGTIAVGLATGAGKAEITVADNGVGIEQSMLGQVFEPFVQAGSAMHLAQGGLGIGLSLAKGLVELHGGAIVVASGGPGCGSTFTVKLPQALTLASRRGRDETRAIGPAAALRKTILVADDNVDAAHSLALLLRSEGAEVAVAHDGEAALRMFSDRPADIAVLDLGMPKMDGLEVAMALSRSSPRPFLVALTGRGRGEDRAASLEAGFDEHLTKPVAPHKLIELLQRV